MSDNIVLLREPDPLAQARAEREAAIAELGQRSERLVDRLLELHDDEALKQLDAVLVAVQNVTAKQEDGWVAFYHSLDRIHEAELRLLGSNRQDAARRLLESQSEAGAASGVWPNSI